MSKVLRGLDSVNFHFHEQQTLPSTVNGQQHTYNKKNANSNTNTQNYQTCSIKESRILKDINGKFVNRLLSKRPYENLLLENIHM